jgi:hypothetical protein
MSQDMRASWKTELKCNFNAIILLIYSLGASSADSGQSQEAFSDSASSPISFLNF